jgi:hypothetical protein
MPYRQKLKPLAKSERLARKVALVIISTQMATQVVSANYTTGGPISQSVFADQDNGMIYEELEQLSKAELIEMVLHQQAQIEKLRTTLTRLKARLAESEVRRKYLAAVVKAAKLREKEGQQPIEADVMGQRKREWATRDALRHLDDVAYLGRSPLAELIAKAQGARPDGRTLQQNLYETIEAMRPVEGQPLHPRQPLRYDILRLTYLERKRAAESALSLAVSERQYYRELKAAIQIVAEHVLETRS